MTARVGTLIAENYKLVKMITRNHRYNLYENENKIDIYLIIFEKGAKGEMKIEVLGNGMVELEIRNKDNLLDVGFFLHFLYRTTGEEAYCLEKICKKRGLLAKRKD